MKEWQTYEEVAEYLIRKFYEEFKLNKVEGKQKLVGESGTEWEVDAKGVYHEDESIVVIEARRYTTTRLPQSQIARLAYSIKDVGAAGGIIVSPLGLQKGAKIIAEKENIITVKIDADSTPEAFTMEFFNKLVIGVPPARLKLTGHPPTVIIGNTEDSD